VVGASPQARSIKNRPKWPTPVCMPKHPGVAGQRRHFKKDGGGRAMPPPPGRHLLVMHVPLGVDFTHCEALEAGH
jgi:hypothetical protein